MSFHWITVLSFKKATKKRNWLVLTTAELRNYWLRVCYWFVFDSPFPFLRILLSFSHAGYITTAEGRMLNPVKSASASVKPLQTSDGVMCSRRGVSRFVGFNFTHYPLWLCSKGQGTGEGVNMRIQRLPAWPVLCPLRAAAQMTSYSNLSRTEISLPEKKKTDNVCRLRHTEHDAYITS